jgi:DNA polymerase
MRASREEIEMTAADFLPEKKTLKTLAEAAAGCQGCELYKNATQTVFGKGPSSARVVMVGEVPGDQEDRQGEPFIGPAGKLLDTHLAEAGIDRGVVYVTNAVKHFKWEPKGKRRLHKKPGAREIAACRPWLEAEMEVLGPDVVVCLGATAAQALIGRDFRITRQRGEFVPTDWSRWTIATYHPSAVLRAPDEDARAKMADMLQEDLKKVAAKLHELEAAG